MNRDELIREISKQTGILHYNVENIVKGYEDLIIKHLKDGDDIHLHGFVTFQNKKHNEKIYVNPKTGEHKKIEQHHKLKVIVSDKLDRAVNGITE